MKTVAFDLGGVLRPVYLPGAAERNWEALRSMYVDFVESPQWRVVITSKRPPGKDTVESIVEELVALNLPEPDDIKICAGSKTKIYSEVKPDLVIDDSEDHIRQALCLGITTLKVD
jgi:FMN phosphatase YigB (HAD superfamily)